MIGLILTIILICFIAGTVYMTFCIGRFQGIKKIAGEKKWLRHLISFFVLALCFLIVSHALSVPNAVVIFLHAVAFFLIFDLIFLTAKRIRGYEPKAYLQGWLAIAFCTVYLMVGWYLLHHVFQTDYNLTTDKDASIKIALIADSHLGTSFDGDGFAQHMETIEKQKPDLLVIAGDFVDDSSKKKDMIKACEALGKMNLEYGVFYVYGNHDKGYFNTRDFSAEELEAELIANGVHVLKDEAELIDNHFYIVGRKDKSMERLEIDELLKGLDTSRYIIVADHQPGDYDKEAESTADLVLSGHTHGGWFFPVTIINNLLKIDDRLYGHEQRNGTDFIVTSGISDWDLKFKTGTKSEYVIVNIGK